MTEAEAELFVAEVEMALVDEAEDDIDANTRSASNKTVNRRNRVFHTNCLASRRAGAGERAHGGVGVAAAKLGDLGLHFGRIGTADGVKVRWVRLGAVGLSVFQVPVSGK